MVAVTNKTVFKLMENNNELEKKSDVVQPDTEVKTNEEQTTPGASPETKPQADVSAELEKVRATLEKAEHTIVELKKAKKQEEDGGAPSYTDEDIEAKVNEIVERKLNEITPKQDETLTQLAEAKRRVVEMSETLKAKSAIVNDGGATNQDKTKPDVEVPLTPQENELLSHMALKLGMSVRDYKIKYGYIRK